MVFMAIRYNRMDDKTMMDALTCWKDSFNMFTHGSLNQIAGMLGKACNGCQQKVEANDSETDEKYVIFLMREKMAIADVLKDLFRLNLRFRLESSFSLSEFADEKNILCQQCTVGNRPRPVPPPRVQKRPLAAVDNTPARPASTTLVEPSEPEKTPRESPTADEDQPSPSPVAPVPAKRARLEPNLDDDDISQNITPVNRKGRKSAKIRDEEASFEATPIHLTSSGRTVKTTLKKKETDEFENEENQRHIEAVCQKCNRTLRALNKKGYNCAMMTNITGHIKTHSDIIPFQCNTCDHKCRFESAMKKHSQGHGENASFTNNSDAPEYKAEMVKLLEECFPTWA